jgi:hypothetical protein
MTKAVKTADASAAKWARNLGMAGPSITAGVQAVQQAPGIAAAAQKNTWLQNVTASADRWAQNVSKVSLASWQQSMLQKGVSRITGGAATAQPKVQAFMQSFLPAVQQIAAQLPPRGDINANISRMTAMVQALHAKKGQFKQAGK